MGNELTLAMADPLNIFAIDNVQALTGMNIVPIITRASLVQQNIEKYYATDSGETLQKIYRDMKEADDIELVTDSETRKKDGVEDFKRRCADDQAD